MVWSWREAAGWPETSPWIQVYCAWCWAPGEENGVLWFIGDFIQHNVWVHNLLNGLSHRPAGLHRKWGYIFSIHLNLYILIEAFMKKCELFRCWRPREVISNKTLWQTVTTSTLKKSKYSTNWRFFGYSHLKHNQQPTATGRSESKFKKKKKKTSGRWWVISLEKLKLWPTQGTRGKVIMIIRIINVCTTCHGNSSKSCWGISACTKVVDWPTEHARITGSQGDTISAYSCEGTVVVNQTIYSIYKGIKQKSHKSSPWRSCNHVSLLDKLSIKYWLIMILFLLNSECRLFC